VEDRTKNKGAFAESLQNVIGLCLPFVTVADPHLKIQDLAVTCIEMKGYSD